MCVTGERRKPPLFEPYGVKFLVFSPKFLSRELYGRVTKYAFADSIVLSFCLIFAPRQAAHLNEALGGIYIGVRCASPASVVNLLFLSHMELSFSYLSLSFFPVSSTEGSPIIRPTSPCSIEWYT